MTRRSGGPRRTTCRSAGPCSTTAASPSSARGNGRAPRPICEHALELKPDQPLVLNYLGYSWIDQGENLDRGLKMIESAVELQPDDGYIVDSLGWAHYRLGDYAGAVQYLERAIELVPEDPTINDHLGDAYWRTGRLDRGALSVAARAAVRPRGGRDQADRGQARARPLAAARRPPRRRLSGQLDRMRQSGAAVSRLRAGQDQSLSACRRPAGGRLSSARQPRRLRRYRRRGDRRAGRPHCRCA